MVNCAKCGTPNPETGETCLACGGSLGGQRFAQELDRVRTREKTGAQTAVAVDARNRPPAPPPAPAREAAARDAGPFVAAPSDGGAAEVEGFVRKERARRRRKQATYTVLSVLTAGALGAYLFLDAQKKRRQEEAALFLQSFTEVDAGPIATFWRCGVRAKQADIHRAKDNLVVTAGLAQAFAAFPTSQADYLRNKCLPQIAAALADLDALKPPSEFVEPIGQLKQALGEVRSAFDTYIEKLASAAEQASHEKDIVDAAQLFHGGDAAKGPGYVALLECAVPELRKMAAAVKQPPDTQAVVEFIFNGCKSDPSFANTIRQTCFPKLASIDKSATYRLAAQNLQGDGRDLEAIQYCFKQANRGFLDQELGIVGKSWVDYRNAVKAVLGRVSAYREG